MAITERLAPGTGRQSPDPFEGWSADSSDSKTCPSECRAGAGVQVTVNLNRLGTGMHHMLPTGTSAADDAYGALGVGQNPAAGCGNVVGTLVECR
jgi:hypothetical protein